MPKFSINVKPMFDDEYRDSGMAYDLNYYRWIREAAAQYFTQLGGQATGGIAISLKIETILESPLLMTEEAKVYHQITKIGRSSLTYENKITEASSDRPIATITTTQVTMDPETGKSIPIPEENKKLMIAFEGAENVEVK